ncbi:hypothetical protein DRO53_04000 [Candidatus Bathyarchaeota archaeon]|nr:MAG: hypothetical protein DRO53_04000 [Candidatus Bathyarchaeota archaeon]
MISLGLTDREIFGRLEANKPKRVGRPPINRELAYQLIKSGLSTQKIRRILKCSDRTVRMLRRELELKGELVKPLEPERIDKLEMDFDEECREATGYDFKEWLKSHRER